MERWEWSQEEIEYLLEGVVLMTDAIWWYDGGGEERVTRDQVR